MVPSDEFNDTFDASTLAILQQAFDAAWRDFLATGKAPAEADVVTAARQTLASRVLAVANSGVRDAHALKTEALRALL
jgi:hypothetical protein